MKDERGQSFSSNCELPLIKKYLSNRHTLTNENTRAFVMQELP